MDVLAKKTVVYILYKEQENMDSLQRVVSSEDTLARVFTYMGGATQAGGASTQAGGGGVPLALLLCTELLLDAA